MKKTILSIAFLCALAGAQTIPQVTTNLLTFPGPQPAQVQQVQAQVVGNPGNQTYYVWVVADYTIGNASPSPSFMVRNAPTVLSASNYIKVFWTPPSGSAPNSYDVLLTTDSGTPFGACNCAAVKATTGTTYNIQSNTLQSYTVTTYSGATTFNVNNLPVGGAESQLTFAADQGTQMKIDNVSGVFAKSIEGVKYADQFSGADPGAQINAAEAALPSSGGIISLTGFTGTQAITTDVVLDKPTVLIFGDANFTCDGAPSPCFDVTSSLVAFEGPAQGTGPTSSYGQNISYTGAPASAYTVIEFNAGASTQTSYDAVRNLKISIDDTSTAAAPIPQVTAIYAANPVGLDVNNVFVSHTSPSGATNNSVVGIQLVTTYGSQVPQPGYTHIQNYLYTGTAGSSSVGSGSRGIWIDGTSTQGIVNVSVSGFCNIEDAEYGIDANYATNVKMDDGCFLQGDGTALNLSHTASSTFDLLRTNQSYVQDYAIDSGSSDNTIANASFANASGASTDAGNRTTWINSSNGQVGAPYIAGPIGGVAATSSANVNSYKPDFAGNYWNGVADANCTVSPQLTFASGADPQATFGWTTSGCAGTPTWSIAGMGQVVGTPTGGNEGAGTLNAQGLYINGVAVGTGGGGVSSLQFDSNTALTGAVKVVSGPGLSTSQTGQQVTLNPNAASGTQIGMVQLTNCLGGTDTAPTVTCMPWNDLTAPTGALSLSMGANVSTFTFGAATGAGVNLFNLTDTASNTGTGYLFTSKVASGSSASPFQACGIFNCIQVSNSGRFEIGNGVIAATTTNNISLLDQNGNGIVGLIDNGTSGGGGVAPAGFTNSGSGTTLNALASLTSTGAETTLTSATTGAIGVVMAGNGTSGAVTIVTSGIAYCQFDATAVTEGDWVQISSTTAGDCHDAGSTKPASGEIVGIATSTGSASTKQFVDVQISW